MRNIEIRSAPKTIAPTLNSWELLEVFDVVKFIDGRFFIYTVDGFVITLRERGTYEFQIVLNLTTSEEVAYGISLRLVIDGVAQEIKAKGWSESTILFNEYVSVAQLTEVIIEIFIATDETPDIIVNEDNMLFITKRS
jgi:hypothetical protein